MSSKYTCEFSSTSIVNLADGEYEVDMQNLTEPNDAGILFCNISNEELGMPEGRRLDTSKPIRMVRTFYYDTIPE